MLCDVELQGGEAESIGIPCHRSVLSVHSRYFRTMFLTGMKESAQPIIQLHNISHPVLSQLIDFFYMTDIVVTEDSVQPILVAAAFLSIPAVEEACWKFMEDRLNASNCLMLYCFADSDAHKNLAVAAKAKAITLQHFADIAQGPDFLEVPKKTVGYALPANGLGFGGETDCSKMEQCTSRVTDLICCDSLCVAQGRRCTAGHRAVAASRFPATTLAVLGDAAIYCIRSHILNHRVIRPTYLGPQGSDDYLLACVNAFTDYSEKAPRPSGYLQALPGYTSQASSRYTARKSYCKKATKK
ncbi:kelch-like protein 17 isoform X3 [Paramacrobiotus metropolitanus]|uniref:kelch-like protein 17 isoform X3 n=1 Tax=Paramacrobiotus metropolitanus TaxID=2943436 RepID=UPI002445A542|nr:kelch-like protein 17 isoform X3 [Paramacrobiotus metropolitanus]